MGLFDAFKFKKDIAKVFSKEGLLDILTVAKRGVIAQVQKNIPGVEKKAIVDDLVISTIKGKAVGCTNKIVLWVVDKVIEIIPTFTQSVYDNLKEKIENLTV